jgi:hypothetical protein
MTVNRDINRVANATKPKTGGKQKQDVSDAAGTNVPKPPPSSTLSGEEVAKSAAKAAASKAKKVEDAEKDKADLAEAQENISAEARQSMSRSS